MFTNKLGVVKELTNVNPLEEVFEEIIFSTLLPNKSTAWAFPLEKVMVPNPLIQFTAPLPDSEIVKSPPTTML